MHAWMFDVYFCNVHNVLSHSTFCIQFECDKCLNMSFDLFARCDNNEKKRIVQQLTREWATVFVESKERIYSTKYTKKWDFVKQFETVSDSFTYMIAKGTAHYDFANVVAFFSLHTHEKKRIELKMGNVERNLERITSTLIYEQRFFTLIPQIDFVSICRCVCVCFLLPFFAFTLWSLSYPFVAEFVFDFTVRGAKKERKYIYEAVNTCYRWINQILWAFCAKICYIVSFMSGAILREPNELIDDGVCVCVFASFQLIFCRSGNIHFAALMCGSSACAVKMKPFERWSE